MELSQRSILPLTSVRFFAAFYVVLYHTLTDLIPGREDPYIYRGDLLGLGFISVSFFFVLSGFILGRVYLTGARQLDARTFWRARFARVYPLFLATLLLDTPHALLANVHKLGVRAGLVEIGKILSVNLVMLQAWFPRFRGIDNPNWSLSVEALFYLSFPFLAVLLLKRRSWVLAGIASVSYIVGLTVVASLSLPREVMSYNPLLHLHEFVEGICLALITLRLPESRLKPIAAPALASGAAGLALFLLLARHLASWRYVIHDGLLSPLFLLLIIGLTYGSGPVHRALSHPWLVLAGEASYGLYLIHLPVWNAIKHAPYGHNLRTYPIYLATCIALSIVGFLRFEGPARRALLAHTKPKETLLTSSAMQ